MAITTCEALLLAFKNSNLLNFEQYCESQTLVQDPNDLAALGRLLVGRGWITEWQGQQTLAGRNVFFIGRYRLLKLLGRGGMGDVYLARHETMQRLVALKVILPEFSQNATFRKRLVKEARAAGALDHPNIVHAYSLDNEGDQYYLVMEYVEGQDLQQKVAKSGRLGYEEAGHFIQQAAEGLAHAHSKGIIHCDIKPANLLVTPDGVVKILDLGTAKLNTTLGGANQPGLSMGGGASQSYGTVDYMAPEQGMKGSGAVDRRADIYSLGCTFYFLLTGQPPFGEGSMLERIMKHQMQEPTNVSEIRPDVPKSLATICHKMMAKDVAERFQQADQVSFALKVWGEYTAQHRPAASRLVDDGEAVFGEEDDEDELKPFDLSAVLHNMPAIPTMTSRIHRGRWARFKAMKSWKRWGILGIVGLAVVAAMAAPRCRRTPSSSETSPIVIDVPAAPPPQTPPEPQVVKTSATQEHAPGKHQAAPGPDDDLVIADFEGHTYSKKWTIEGDAFGRGPTAGPGPDKRISGWEGSQFACSAAKGNDAKGRMVTPEFTIRRKWIQFLLAGGAKKPLELCMQLVVDGQPARTAANQPGCENKFRYMAWNVADLQGKKARLELIDQATGNWGYLLVDQIVMTNHELQKFSMTLQMDQNYLHMPVKNGGRRLFFQIFNNKTEVRSFELELAAHGAPDWWASLDLSEFRGKKLQLKCTDGIPPSQIAGMDKLFHTSEDSVDATDLYREPLRPQLHFTARHGWQHQPIGLVWFNKEYHLFYQHNPLGLWQANTFWGHAVSSDLLHWTELLTFRPMDPRAGMVVDQGNKSALGKQKDALVIASSIEKDSLRLMTGTGRLIALTDVPGSRPICIGHSPRILRDQPHNKWIMIVTEHDQAKGMTFYESSNLKSWNRLFSAPGGGNTADFFELPIEGKPDRKWILYGSGSRTLTKNGKQERHNISSAYQIGTFNGAAFQREPKTDWLPLVAGWNAGGGQSFDDLPDGRHILLCPLVDLDYMGMPFSGALTVPLELRLKATSEGLRLLALPIREFSKLRVREEKGKSLNAEDANKVLAKVPAELLDIELVLRPGAAGKVSFSVRGVPINYDATAARLCGAHVPLDHGLLRLRILVDRGLIEVFGGDGLVVIPMKTSLFSVHPELILTSSDKSNTLVESIQIAELKSIWAP